MVTLITLLVVVFLGATSFVHATYLSDSDGNLYFYDIDTNTYTLIGNSGYGPWYDIALNPLTGMLYGVTYPGSLYSINTSDGSANCIGSTGSFINGLAFDNSGNLYGSGYTHLYTIDLSNGSATQVAYTGYNSSGDIAFDEYGNIYMTANDNWTESSDRLIYYDFSDNSVSEIGEIGYYGVYGIGFSGDTLYGFTAGKETITIDTGTGGGTLVFNNGITAYGADTTAAPVPEPSTVLLLGLGLICMAGYGRKRFSKKA